MENKTCDHRYNRPEAAAKPINRISLIQISKWHTSFENQFIRMKKCVDVKVEYFEKQ